MIPIRRPTKLGQPMTFKMNRSIPQNAFILRVYFVTFGLPDKKLILLMEKPLLQGIDTLILRVTDIQSAKAWYSEKLGFPCLYEDENLKLAVLDPSGPVSLTLWETNEKIETNPKTSSYPIFRSADARSTREKLNCSGVKVSDLVNDHAIIYFTFQDPDGNHLEVCQVHE